MPRTWVNGVETVLTESEWARRAAAFLGCGFRVVVPSGPVRTDALADARRQAFRIAELFDATFDEAPWQAAASCEDPVEVAGGWRHQFRGPSGASTTRVSPLSGPTPPFRRLRCTRLPWALDAHSPLAGLPMVSGFEESRALTALGTETAGLWWNTDDHLVSSTAGPLLLRADGTWLVPSLESGTVPHLLWSRAAELLGARALPVDDEILATAESLHAIDPLGNVAALGGDEGSVELLDAVGAVLHTT